LTSFRLFDGPAGHHPPFTTCFVSTGCFPVFRFNLFPPPVFALWGRFGVFVTIGKTGGQKGLLGGPFFFSARSLFGPFPTSFCGPGAQKKQPEGGLGWGVGVSEVAPWFLSTSPGGFSKFLLANPLPVGGVARFFPTPPFFCAICRCCFLGIFFFFSCGPGSPPTGCFFFCVQKKHPQFFFGGKSCFSLHPKVCGQGPPCRGRGGFPANGEGAFANNQIYTLGWKFLFC